jgi:hypothetical protein
MSLFGIEQMGNVMFPSRSGDREDRVKGALDDVAGATEGAFSERTKSVYESGDKLQGEMVDVFFDAFKDENTSPSKIMNRMADFVEDSAEAIRKVAGEEKEEKEEESAG